MSLPPHHPESLVEVASRANFSLCLSVSIPWHLSSDSVLVKSHAGLSLSVFLDLFCNR